MATLAELEGWRSALMEARYSGTRTVQYGESRVEYKTDAEMQAALSDLERKIAQLSKTQIRDVRVFGTKGL